MVDQVKSREDEWFLKNEKDTIEAARVARERREKERAEKEQAEVRRRLKELHFMKCPKCGHDMKERDFEGILIDVCSFCEGIYLDARELEGLFLKREAERKGMLKRLLGL